MGQDSLKERSNQGGSEKIEYTKGFKDFLDKKEDVVVEPEKVGGDVEQDGNVQNNDGQKNSELVKNLLDTEENKPQEIVEEGNEIEEGLSFRSAETDDDFLKNFNENEKNELMGLLQALKDRGIEAEVVDSLMNLALFDRERNVLMIRKDAHFEHLKNYIGIVLDELDSNKKNESEGATVSDVSQENNIENQARGNVVLENTEENKSQEVVGGDDKISGEETAKPETENVNQENAQDVEEHRWRTLS